MGIMRSVMLLRAFVFLRKNFRQYFSIEPALTQQVKQEVYHIRHQVYCRELGWEPENFLEQETDDYDVDSVHCVMRSVKSGEYVGCIRLILPRSNEPFFPLPFEKACGSTLNYKLLDPLARSRFAIAEVSRLAVIGKYRRRKYEQQRPVGLSDDDYGSVVMPRFPYIPVGLYLGMLDMARRNEVETLYILTEPWLAEHFSHLGIKLISIGSAVEHHGKRVPLMMNVNEALAGLSLFIRPLFNEIASEMEYCYQADDQVMPPDNPGNRSCTGSSV